MPERKVNIALLCPTQTAYSETFIQAHKERLEGNIFCYFGNSQNIELEGKRSPHESKIRWKYKFLRKLKAKSYSWYFDRLTLNSFKINNIDVILVEYGDFAATHIDLLKESGLPVVVHFHGYDASVTEIIQKFKKYKELFDCVKYVVAVSKKMYKDLLEMGCPKKKLIYNVYGPCEEFLKINPSFRKQQFIAIGRFVDKKAPYYLILTFLRVVRKFPNAKLIIAGDGKLLNVSKNLVRQFGLERNIGFPDVISPTEYKNYLSESLAMVQHSITAENGDSEGTPVAILEASAAGLPVISTYHAGIPDVIEHGYSGLLVEEHDIRKMANYFIKLLENINLAKQLGVQGKRRVQESFTLHKHISGLNELIHKLVKK